MTKPRDFPRTSVRAPSSRYAWPSPPLLNQRAMRDKGGGVRGERARDGGRWWRWRERCGGGGWARGAPLALAAVCGTRAPGQGGSGQKAWGKKSRGSQRAARGGGAHPLARSHGGQRAARGGGAHPPRTVARRHGRAEAERAAGAAAPAAERADRRSPHRERATEAVVQAEAPARARLARARVVQGGDCRASRPALAVPREVDRVEEDQLGRRCRRHAVGDQCLPATAAAAADGHARDTRCGHPIRLPDVSSRG